MSVLYVTEQGAVLCKRDGRIVVTKEQETLLEMPLIHVENVAVFGNVQVTTQTLRTLMEQGIDISYFSGNGTYLGRVQAESSKNIFLRMEQYQVFQHPEQRLEAVMKHGVSTDVRIKIPEGFSLRDRH